MAFLAPAIPAITAIAAVGGTAVSIQQAQQAKKDARRRREEEALAAGEALRKEYLLADKADRTRQRFAAGSNQNTILGGEGSQAEIGRKVLLGQ